MEELELQTGTPTLTHYMIFEQVLDLFEPPFPHCLGMLGSVVVLAAAATCTESEARWRRRQWWWRRRIEPPQPGARCRAREGREGRGAGGGGSARRGGRRWPGAGRAPA